VVLEAVFAPIAFTLVVLAVIVWAFAQRLRRRRSHGGKPDTGETETSIRRESPDPADSERRRRYG
jgi:hypothetical protein